MTYRKEKMRLLDTFCKAGGTTKGYQRAGFDVVGVDIEPQPHYCGDAFIQGCILDALGVVESAAWDKTSPQTLAYGRSSGTSRRGFRP